jgi:hypothetical protein
MIPVQLYGVDAERCERFYEELPALVAGMHDDLEYQSVIFSAKEAGLLETVRVADRWMGHDPFAWPEDIAIEVEMALRTARYPDVGLFEHLMTLDGVDAARISAWAHLVSRVFPVYSEAACAALEAMGLPTPFRPDDIASYGLYVSRIEGLKKHAPAAGLPEIGLPRARVLQVGLERFA